MVELLVVITIIAILISISYVVLADSLERARVDATRATIRQLDSALQERIEALSRVNMRSQAVDLQQRYNAYSGPNDPPFMPLEVAEIIVRKDRYRAALPQRLEDLWGLDGVPGGGDDSPLWNVWMSRTGFSARDEAAPDPLESSELLLLALTEGSVFGTTPLPLDQLNPRHVRDANGNGLPEIYDDWGQPIRFYNWPTRLVRSNGTGAGEASAPPSVPVVNHDLSAAYFSAVVLPLMSDAPRTSSDLAFNVYSHPLNQDPVDQTGALTATQNATDPGLGRQSFGLAFRPNLAMPLTEGFYHTFDTWYVPLIVSSGPDERLGLNEPALAGDAPQRPAEVADPTQLDSLYDNLTNRQR